MGMSRSPGGFIALLTFLRGSRTPSPVGVMQGGEASQVRQVDRGAVAKQETDRVGPVAQGGPVEGTAAVHAAARVEGVDLRAGGERLADGDGITAHGGVPEPGLGVLGPK